MLRICEAMELHIYNVSLHPRNRRPEQVAHTWSDSHQRWLPQFAQDPQSNTAGITAVGAGTSGASLGEGGDHAQKPNTISATAPTPSGNTLSTDVDQTPGGDNSVASGNTANPQGDVEMDSNDKNRGDKPDPPPA